MEICPVSSETMITRESVTSEIPSPARCRSPYSGGRSSFSVTGRITRGCLYFVIFHNNGSIMQRTGFIEICWTNSLLEVSAFSISPVSAYMSRLDFLLMTISAPVFSWENCMTAFRMDRIFTWDLASKLEVQNLFNTDPVPVHIPGSDEDQEAVGFPAEKR